VALDVCSECFVFGQIRVYRSTSFHREENAEASGCFLSRDGERLEGRRGVGHSLREIKRRACREEGRLTVRKKRRGKGRRGRVTHVYLSRTFGKGEGGDG